MKNKLIIAASSILLIGTLLSCQNKENYSNGEILNYNFLDNINHWNVISNGIKVNTDNNYLQITNNNSKEEINQKIKNLKEGFYTLTVKCKNECTQEYCYIYGKGTKQKEVMTSIPKSYKGDWIDVVLHGIKVSNDGLLEIGVKSYGDGTSFFDEFNLSYDDNYEELLLGGAISWLDWEESKGAKYYDFDGIENDALKILNNNGCNAVRLELYNNPGEYKDSNGNYFPKEFKCQESILKLARRATDLSMKIQLSFMYSDYWGNDSFPVDWKEILDGINDYNKKIDKLCELVYDYTYSYMTKLKENDIFVDYVSIGNEIDPGILLPYGSSTDNEKDFARLLKQGYKAVKDASPSTLVVLHLGCNANDMHWSNRNGGGKWFFNLMKENNVEYDIIGTSFYPFWAQTNNEYASKKKLDLDDFKEWCIMMNETFNKKVLVMETGYNWGKPGQLSNNGAYENIYESTPSGQRNYMYDLINTMKSLNGKCIGCLYWDPILVKQAGIGYALYGNGMARENCVETTTFFDYDHKALPVLNSYKYN